MKASLRVPPPVEPTVVVELALDEARLLQKIAGWHRIVTPEERHLANELYLHLREALKTR